MCKYDAEYYFVFRGDDPMISSWGRTRKQVVEGMVISSSATLMGR